MTGLTRIRQTRILWLTRIHRHLRPRQTAASKHNKWSKNCDNRPHHRGGFFTREKLTWHRPVGSNAVDCIRRRHWFFGTQQWLFNGLDIPMENLDPINTPTQVTLQIASRSISRFCMAHQRNQQTDTQTNRPHYFICRNRPHLSGPCGSHMGPIYRQPTWASRGTRGQTLLGPTWPANMGPGWMPIWVPCGYPYMGTGSSKYTGFQWYIWDHCSQ